MPPVQHCRFYRPRFPEVDEVVMVNVKSIAEMGAYVQLLEYDGVEGMILLSELSRRRIRSINKLIRVGRNECVVVLRVDKEKGYIDLSKRRVSVEEAKQCEDRFMKAKAVHSILRHVAEAEHMDLEELFDKTAWTLEDTRGKGTAHDAFKLALGDNPDVLTEMKVDERVRQVLLDNIRRRLTPQPVKIRSDFEVSCYEYAGIDAVKEALRAGLAVADESHQIRINLIAPPLYVMTTTSLDKDKGIAKLTEAIEAIQKTIQEKSGSIAVKMAPRSVTEADDKELAAKMEQYENENNEVAGDEEGSDGGEEVGMAGPAGEP